MTLIYLIVLLAIHYFTGSGLLHFFRLQLDTYKWISLSLLCGIVIASFVPFLLQLAYIPITFASVSIGLLLVCCVLNLFLIPHVRNLKGMTIIRNRPQALKLYEWPFMLIIAVILLASVWRSFYFPVFARDMLSGPEVIAEYAVREHTMINSVFTINLETTNNHHKPPYILSLQIIYKLIGFPFGQIWVSFIAVAFTVFLYQLLRERVHAIIAGALLLCFFVVPELYAYTYIMLFDYSNMVFFFLAVYFLQQHFKTSSQNNLYFSAILFAFATYMRLETLVFTAMILPALWLNAYRNKSQFRLVLWHSAIIVALPAIIYFLWVNIYLRYYMPAQFHLGQQINPNLSDFNPLIERFTKMNTLLLFGKYSRPLWGYFMPMFVLLALADLLMYRKISREARTWYYATAVIYFGLPLLGFLLPLMDLLHTTKRGLFKLFPFMLLILANTHLLQQLSAKITRWELSVAPQPTRPKFIKKVRRKQAL